VRADPLFHTILSTDVAKSSGRNDNLLFRMRADLRNILDDTLRRQRFDVEDVTWLDDGDGFRLIAPAGIAPHALVGPFVDQLGVELRAHREAAASANRLRLRVALHSGLLFREPSGSFFGTPLKDCARLLDADAGRRLLDDHPQADLVLLLTDVFYRDVVLSGTTRDPATFQRIEIKVKETDAYGWAYVPSVTPPPPPGATPPPPPPPPPPSRSSSVVVNLPGNSGAAHFGTIVGGDSYG
jgi:hypothetical protein